MNDVCGNCNLRCTVRFPGKNVPYSDANCPNSNYQARYKRIKRDKTNLEIAERKEYVRKV